MIDPQDKAAQAILDLIAERGPGKTICPSEAARRLAGDDWRKELKRVRRIALNLAAEGRITVLKKGKAVPDPLTVKGVIRLGPAQD